MRNLKITHGNDGNWYVVHRDHEYVFNSFEDVSRWVENSYWELEEQEVNEDIEDEMGEKVKLFKRYGVSI